MKGRVVTLVVLLAAILTLAASLRSPASYSQPVCETERVFYSDNTFSTQVGSDHVTCNGFVHTGSRTNHYEFFIYGGCQDDGVGTCEGFDFGCSNGVIIWAGNPSYVGNSCPTYVP
jgi:hypothetical protein